MFLCTDLAPSYMPGVTFWALFFTSVFDVFLNKSSHCSFAHRQATIVIFGDQEEVLEESIKVSRYRSEVVGAVKRLQLWLLGLPEGCWSSQRQGTYAVGEYTLKEKKMEEKASLLLLVQDTRSLVKEQEMLTCCSGLDITSLARITVLLQLHKCI